MDYSVEHDKIKVDKYTIIYNGVDIKQYNPNYDCINNYKNEFLIDSNDIVIGNVGVLSVRKGQKYLLESFNKLLKHRDNLKLLIFGSEREHEKKIADEIYYLIDYYNLKNKVKIIKPRKDLNKIYNIFDIFVMPSITEGLSLCAIEAMLMERICLFSNVPSFKEMIDDGKNGFLFNSTNVDDLYLKLDYIINNYSSLDYIKKNARVYALENYNIKRMINQYEVLYFDMKNDVIN
jgi:glycosyltransferase involved in cell wall biosynthesis